MGLDMYEYYWHELNTEINNYNWTRFSLGWATSTFSLTASDIDSNEQTVMASLMIELAKFIPVKLNLQGCIQVFWISYVVYFWITQITQTLKMASHECHGLFENPLTDFLIILITLRVESLQPASSGRDQQLSGPLPRVDRCMTERLSGLMGGSAFTSCLGVSLLPSGKT